MEKSEVTKEKSLSNAFEDIRILRKTTFSVFICLCSYKEKNGFVTATKLRTTNEFFVASTKNFAAATKRFVDRTKHFVVVVTKYFCYP